MRHNVVAFPAAVSRDRNGRFVVRFPDLPDISADGPSEEDALQQAKTRLSQALTRRIDEATPIPRPSLPESGQQEVAPDQWVALRLKLERYIKQRTAW